MEELDMVGHGFGAAAAVPALGAAQVGEVVASLGHVLPTLTAPLTLSIVDSQVLQVLGSEG